MQISKIKVGQWYATERGDGRCTNIGKSVLRAEFEINGKLVWLAGVEVEHEIQPQEQASEQVENLDLEVARLRRVNRMLKEALEQVHSDIGEALQSKTLSKVQSALTEANKKGNA